MKITDYLNKYISSLENKTIIITGANSGIGFEVAKMAAFKKGHVVLAGRNKQKILDAMEDIKKDIPDAKLDYLIFDQTSFASIENFVDSILKDYPNFDSLFLNAGILKPKQETFTEDGFPLVVGTNFYGVYHLLNKLYPHIKDTETEKRILIEGSLIARWSTYKSNKYDLIRASSTQFKSYNISKIGVENLFYHYAVNNQNPNLKFLLSEPGICKTDIIKNFPEWIKAPANWVLRVFTHSPQKGGLTSLHLLSEKHHNGDIMIPRGLFSINGLPRTKSKFSHRTKKHQQIIADGELIIKSKKE